MDKLLKFFSAVIAVCAKYTFKMFFTVKRDPGKLSGMIIQKSRGKAYAFMSCNIGERVVVIWTVKIIDMHVFNDSLLDGF